MVLHLLALIDARKFLVAESNLHHLPVSTQTFGKRTDINITKGDAKIKKVA